MTNTIQHNQNSTNGIFFIKEDQKTVASLSYRIENKTMTIDHTEVKPELEGQGIGGKLVKAGYAFAKAENLKINPLCPFAEVVFDKNPEWSDVRI